MYVEAYFRSTGEIPRAIYGIRTKFEQLMATHKKTTA